jgi:LuxR family maltose regulon positive regulatory protein
VRASLAELIRVLPIGLALVIASRVPLRLGLGRLRARRLVADIDATDLTMTSYEAHRVLQSCGVDVGEDALQEVVDRTEGWPAAIQLAARSLHGETYTAETAAAQILESTQLCEYVREEVLVDLDPGTLSALRRLSILELMCGELGDTVLERSGTGHLLQDLHEAGAMIVAQDARVGWYRCHGLVRNVLRVELDRLEPEMARELHFRASEWFEEAGSADRALDHAVGARDAPRVGRLLWDDLGRVMRGREHRAEAWLGAFSPAARAANPAMRLGAALKELMGGSVAAVRQAVGPVSEALDATSPEAPAQRACVYAMDAAAAQGGVEQMGASAQRALDLAPQGPVRSLALLLAGVAAHLRDERDVARTHLREAAGSSEETAPAVRAMALSQRALMDIEDEDWERAAERSRAAAQTLAGHGLEFDATAALTPAVSALVMIRSGFADEAKQNVNMASRVLGGFSDHMPWYEVEARIATARASTRLGDISEARALLAQASRRARRAGDTPRLLEWLDQAWGEVDEASARALAGQGALTIAELRVLRFLPSHLSFREIGERLNVSGNTVKTQTHAIYAKLGVASRSDAVTRAAGLGLIDPAIL